MTSKRTGAELVRHRRERLMRTATMACGVGGDLLASPARFWSIFPDVPENMFVEDDSEQLLRQAQGRLMWAHRLTRPARPFEDVLLAYEKALHKAGAAMTKKKPAQKKRVQKPRKRRGHGVPLVWTEENVIVAIQLWHEEHGRPPTTRDWRKSGDYWPSFTTVITRFGGWNEAIKKAGFSPVSQQQSFSRGDALRLRREGLTHEEVAEALGVHRSTIAKFLREEGAPPRGSPKDLRRRNRNQRIADLQAALKHQGG